MLPQHSVTAVFDGWPPRLRNPLLRLRNIILNTASETEGVGRIEETLKWGQPSYITAETKSGTTIRIDRVKGSGDRYAMYVHCQTNLIESFREMYPNVFTFEGNRAIVFEAGKKLPVRELRECIRLALTYRLRKRA
jgi:hypothetical protein